jgi:hypothetical protein
VEGGRAVPGLARCRCSGGLITSSSPVPLRRRTQASRRDATQTIPRWVLRPGHRTARSTWRGLVSRRMVRRPPRPTAETTTIRRRCDVGRQQKELTGEAAIKQPPNGAG